jgi:hypothetical protein
MSSIFKFINKKQLYNNINSGNIMKSSIQTKIWRKLQKWYKGGKRNECEKFQVDCINKITNSEVKYIKTYTRLNLYTYEMKEINKINTQDKFEWSENFDRLVNVNNKKLYYNLKFICDKGGAQNRSFQLTKFFIHAQYEFLLKNKELLGSIYFINIFDGDYSYKNTKYLDFNDDKYQNIKKYVFIGDLYNFNKSIKEYNSFIDVEFD